MKNAPEVKLRPEEREALLKRVRERTAAQRDVLRARIVLAAADGMTNKEIASTVGCSRPTVGLWRGRFALMGMAGLDDAPRSGRPRRISPEKIADIVAHTMKAPSPRTHWSTRGLAKEHGVSHATVHRIWQRFKLGAPPQRDVQIQPRPRACGQGGGRGWVVPEPA